MNDRLGGAVNSERQQGYHAIRRGASSQQSCPLQEIQCARDDNGQGRQRKTYTVRRTGTMMPASSTLHRATRSTNDNEETSQDELSTT